MNNEKQTNPFGVVMGGCRLNRVGSFHSPTLLYQRTNPYRVVAPPEPTDGCGA